MIQHFHSGGENYVEMAVIKSLLLIFHRFTRGIVSLRMTLGAQRYNTYLACARYWLLSLKTEFKKSFFVGGESQVDSGSLIHPLTI